MQDRVSKFINVMKRDGLLSTIKKSIKYIYANYINKINISKRIRFTKDKNNISNYIDNILKSNNYNRILVWRGSFGWKVPLFQRPQQIANCLIEKNCLIFYEVTRMTDDVKFIKKESDNLYLVNYEINDFEKLLFQKLINVKLPKYLQLYSTCWDVKKEKLDLYLNNGFKMLYEYIDDLNPLLAGTDKLPKNVEDIHNYVINNKEVLVVTSASILYEDMLAKRKDDKNIILSSNGVDIAHFTNLSNDKIVKMEKLKKDYEIIIGYYGALATWFDYDLVRKLANEYKHIAFVLIGIKYDNSYDLSKIEDISNVIYIGPVDYKILPLYARYFDIAWIPFMINEITLATNPIKAFEYMALGKLVITSDLPECHKYKSIKIAKNFEDYKYYINNYKKLNDIAYKKQLKADANNNSWNHKAEEIIELFINNE